MISLLLTRPSERAESTRARLCEAGFAVVHEPLIRLVELPGAAAPWFSPAPDAIAFSSPSAVEFFARREPPLQLVQRLRPWVLGEATAAALHAIGVHELRLALRPDALGLAQSMLAELPVAARVLLPGAKLRRPELAQALRAAGHTPLCWDLYDTQPIERLPAALLARLRADFRPLVLIYSPSALQAWVQLLEQESLPRDLCELACIGPSSGAAARALGLSPRIALERADESALLDELRALDPA